MSPAAQTLTERPSTRAMSSAAVLPGYTTKCRFWESHTAPASLTSGCQRNLRIRNPTRGAPEPTTRSSDICHQEWCVCSCLHPLAERKAFLAICWRSQRERRCLPPVWRTCAADARAGGRESGQLLIGEHLPNAADQLRAQQPYHLPIPSGTVVQRVASPHLEGLITMQQHDEQVTESLRLHVLRQTQTRCT